MHEDRKTDHDEVWDMLPWYAAGTLPPEEARRVADHVESCAICAEELVQERRMSEAIAGLDAVDEIEARGWAEMRARLEQPARHRAAWTWPSLDWLREALTMPQFAGAAVAACLLIIGGAFFFGDRAAVPGDPTFFDTMSPDPAPTGQAIIRIKVAEDVAEAALRALLAEHDLRITDGPSQTGVYTLAPSAEAELAEVAAALSGAPEIAFVSVRTGR